jgi:hypothetical protein
MAELDKLEYPKPLRDFIHATFDGFADRHPWVGEEDIHPKSIAREMFEQFRSFAEYVYDYELQRSEGLLLRHLSSVYKVLRTTVPDYAKTEDVLDMEQYLRTLLKTVDSSLADEWERMREPGYLPAVAAAVPALELRPPGADESQADSTRDRKQFTAAVRARVFSFLRAWSVDDTASALGILDNLADGDGEPWTPERLKGAWERYRAEHAGLRFDPEARNLRHTHVTPDDKAGTWKVEQMLIDPEMANDWVAEFEVDLAASKDANEPVLSLHRLGRFA